MSQPATEPPRGPVLDGPIEDLHFAVITKIIDLRVIMPVLYEWDVDVNGGDLKGARCQEAFKFLMRFLRDNHELPTRDQVKQAVPDFRFVVVPHALMPLCARVFKKQRSAGRFGR